MIYIYIYTHIQRERERGEREREREIHRCVHTRARAEVDAAFFSPHKLWGGPGCVGRRPSYIYVCTYMCIYIYRERDVCVDTLLV